MDVSQSQLTVQKFQLKSKSLKSKNPTTGCFSLIGSSGGMKTKQNVKRPQYTSPVSHVTNAMDVAKTSMLLFMAGLTHFIRAITSLNIIYEIKFPL